MIKFNDGKKISTVVTRIECKKHGAEVGTPCWIVFPDTNPNQPASAVCGKRIRAAGFVGKISETAMQSKRKLTMKKEVYA